MAFIHTYCMETVKISSQMHKYMTSLKCALITKYDRNICLNMWKESQMMFLEICTSWVKAILSKRSSNFSVWNNETSFYFYFFFVWCSISSRSNMQLGIQDSYPAVFLTVSLFQPSACVYFAQRQYLPFCCNRNKP